MPIRWCASYHLLLRVCLTLSWGERKKDDSNTKSHNITELPLATVDGRMAY